MKILNLYAGIGGNRKLWGNKHEITAIENNEDIAKIYQDFFEEDTVIVADAHDYLLKYHMNFDFIWSSPPCPTHSRMNLVNISRFHHASRYADMNLYQEIILLKQFFEGKFCIENVISYYEPLIKPQIIGTHYFWANFTIPKIKIRDTKITAFNKKNITAPERTKRIDMEVKDWYNFPVKRKDTVINNCIHPKLGLHILECSQIKEML